MRWNVCAGGQWSTASSIHPSFHPSGLCCGLFLFFLSFIFPCSVSPLSPLHSPRSLLPFSLLSLSVHPSFDTTAVHTSRSTVQACFVIWSLATSHLMSLFLCTKWLPSTQEFISLTKRHCYWPIEGHTHMKSGQDHWLSRSRSFLLFTSDTQINSLCQVSFVLFFTFSFHHDSTDEKVPYFTLYLLRDSKSWTLSKLVMETNFVSPENKISRHELSLSLFTIPGVAVISLVKAH